MAKDSKDGCNGMRPFLWWFAAGIIIGILLPMAVFGDDDGAEFEVLGFIEFETLVNTYSDQDFSDAVKKNQVRYHLEIQYGTSNLHLFMTPDFYYNPNLFNKDHPYPYEYSSEQNIANNLRISDSTYEIAFNELYVNYMIYPVRLRLGNQIYNWGTADAYNPTAYFNPYDLREFIFGEDDKMRQGAPSLSAMYFADDFTTEFVVAFPHVPTLFAPNGTFWSLDMRDDLFNIIIPEPKSLDAETSNAGLGARLSTTLFQTDLSLSFYHGPDRDPVLVPDRLLPPAPNEPLSVIMDPQYHVVNSFGMDLSKSLGDFTFNFEAAYTPDKYGFINQDLNNISTIRFPFEVRKSEHIAYEGGFNYFVPINSLIKSHTGEMIFTVDWLQSHYFDEDLYGAYITDLLTLRLQDSLMDGRLNLQFTSMFETQNNGTVLWPKIEYDFQNGLTIALAYAYINGELGNERIEPLIYHFKDNDFVTLKVRYRL